MAHDDVIKLLQNYIMLLNTLGITVTKAYLYGSYARNEANENSDIDVMLISEVFDQHNDKIRAKAWMATEKIDVRIEPYMIGLHKFLSDEVSPLLQQVKQEGIEIQSTLITAFFNNLAE